MTVGLPSTDGTVPTIPCVYYSGTTFARSVIATSGAFDPTMTYTWEFLGGPVITGTVAPDGSLVAFRAPAVVADAIPTRTPFLLIAATADGLTRLPYATGKWSRVVA